MRASAAGIRIEGANGARCRARRRRPSRRDMRPPAPPLHEHGMYRSSQSMVAERGCAAAAMRGVVAGAVVRPRLYSPDRILRRLLTMSTRDLEPGIVTDLTNRLTYAGYLRLDKILS